ncbi:MAG: hypothetical protein V3V99_02155 [candidate division Zixibacteria bacterium]
MKTKFGIKLRPNESIPFIGWFWVISSIVLFFLGLFNFVMYASLREDGATLGIYTLIIFISSPFVFISAILFLRKNYLSRAVIEIVCWLALILINIYLLDFIFNQSDAGVSASSALITQSFAVLTSLFIDAGIIVMLLNIRNPELREMFVPKNSQGLHGRSLRGYSQMINRED